MRASYRWASPRPRCHFEGSVRDDSRPRESGVGTYRCCRAQRPSIEASHKLEETTNVTWDAVIGNKLDCGFPALSRGNSANGCARFGRVVVVASNAGLAGYPYTSAYCASKHAVVGLVRAICHGNCWLQHHRRHRYPPGFVATSMAGRSRSTDCAPEGHVESIECTLCAQAELYPPGKSD